jgi:hypothetical protein
MKPKYNPIKSHTPRRGHLHDIFGLSCDDAQDLLSKVKALSVVQKLSTKSGIFSVCGQVAQNDSEFAFLIHEITMLFYQEAEMITKSLEPIKNKLQTTGLNLNGKEEKLPN